MNMEISTYSMTQCCIEMSLFYIWPSNVMPINNGCRSVHTIYIFLSEAVSSKEFHQNETVGHRGMGFFKSPGFPICCDDVTQATYTLHYVGGRNIYGLTLLFDDLDLPPDSYIQVSQAWILNP